MSLQLCTMDGKLVLHGLGFSPLSVDFSRQTVQKRRDAGKKQGLVRACKPAPGVRILDVTAGWGRDAAILASFGAEVVMIERQPTMAALLADGLARSPSHDGFNLSLLHMDAKDYLMALPEADYPDVIYIDPMHPTRQKSALVKKDMQALQALIGADDGVEELILMAIQRVKMRVVVKWPNRLAPLIPPQQILSGKTVQYDIYPSLIKMHGF